MLTFIVEKKDVDTKFSLQELKAFSQKNNARVIIRNEMILTNGVVSWMK
jgi:hypothetical protein